MTEGDVYVSKISFRQDYDPLEMGILDIRLWKYRKNITFGSMRRSLLWMFGYGRHGTFRGNNAASFDNRIVLIDCEIC
jgi:hypothetical protein